MKATRMCFSAWLCPVLPMQTTPIRPWLMGKHRKQRCCRSFEPWNDLQHWIATYPILAAMMSVASCAEKCTVPVETLTSAAVFPYATARLVPEKQLLLWLIFCSRLLEEMLVASLWFFHIPASYNSLLMFTERRWYCPERIQKKLLQSYIPELTFRISRPAI